MSAPERHSKNNRALGFLDCSSPLQKPTGEQLQGRDDGGGLRRVQADALVVCAGLLVGLEDEARDTKTLPLLIRSVPASTMAQQPQGTMSNFYPLEDTGVLLICTVGCTAPARRPTQQHPRVGMSRKVNGGDRGPWGTGAAGEGRRR